MKRRHGATSSRSRPTRTGSALPDRRSRSLDRPRPCRRRIHGSTPRSSKREVACPCSHDVRQYARGNLCSALVDSTWHYVRRTSTTGKTFLQSMGLALISCECDVDIPGRRSFCVAPARQRASDEPARGHAFREWDRDRAALGNGVARCERATPTPPAAGVAEREVTTRHVAGGAAERIAAGA